MREAARVAGMAEHGAADSAAGDSLGVRPSWRSWSTAFLAAAAVQAGCGFLGAAAASHWTGYDYPIALFLACAAGAALSDAVLVPGWVWAPGPFAPWRLAARLAAALAALVLAVPAGFVAAYAVVTGASVPYLIAGILPGLGAGTAADPVGRFLRDLYEMSLLLSGIAAGGAAAGLGAAAAQALDGRPSRAGPPRARVRSHAIGGAAGALALVALLMAADSAHPGLGSGVALPSEGWRIVLLLSPAALAAAALAHGLLVVRDARRAGQAPPPTRTMLRRAAACCAPLLLGAAVLCA